MNDLLHLQALGGLQQLQMSSLRACGGEFEPYHLRGQRLVGVADGLAPTRDAGRERMRLSRYWETVDAERQRRTAALAGQLPPMSPSCRLVVQVPARLEAA